MKISWREVRKTCGDFFESILYFVITIVFLSSIGVWIPFALDLANSDGIQQKTWNEFPWNLITYSFAIVVVAFIDRLLHLFKVSSKYSRNTMEFLLLVVVLIIGCFLVFKSVVHGKFDRICESTYFACIFAVMSWLVWIYVKIRNPSGNSHATIGGNNFNN